MPLSPGPVGIIDTSSAIKVKELLPILADHQKCFAALTRLVKKKLLTYPKQVVEELSRKAEGDIPYLWAQHTQRYLKFLDPPLDYVRTVMAKARDGTRTVVDPRKTHDDADPYVLAEALYIRDQGNPVVVITEDRFDTVSRLSMVRACEILGLPHQRIQEWLRTLGLVP